MLADNFEITANFRIAGAIGFLLVQLPFLHPVYYLKTAIIVSSGFNEIGEHYATQSDETGDYGKPAVQHEKTGPVFERSLFVMVCMNGC